MVSNKFVNKTNCRIQSSTKKKTTTTSAKRVSKTAVDKTDDGFVIDIVDAISGTMKKVIMERND